MTGRFIYQTESRNAHSSVIYVNMGLKQLQFSKISEDSDETINFLQTIDLAVDYSAHCSHQFYFPV
jgi:hypothetical protein